MDEWTGRQGFGGEVHVEGPVRDGWWVHGSYLMHAGQLKLVEVKVFPGENRPIDRSRGADPSGRPDPGEWSHNVVTLDRMPPPASISARLLREVDFSKMAEVAHETTSLAHERADWLESVAEDSPYTRLLVAGMRSTIETPPGKLPDVELAKWAARFDRISAISTSPIQTLADQLGKDRGVVKLFIDAARAKGYLTSPGQGRRRSYITPEATEVLERNKIVPTTRRKKS